MQKWANLDWTSCKGMRKMTEHLIIYMNCIVLYFLVLVLMRIGGKGRGQLSLFDLVVAIMIAELAAIPMEDTSIESCTTASCPSSFWFFWKWPLLL